MEEYVNKAELTKRGFRKGKDGIFRKASTLEQLAEKGWLDFGSGNFSAMDRISAGNRFYQDFQMSGIQALYANDLAKIRVDGQSSHNVPEKRLLAQERFRRALRDISPAFFPIIHRVVLEDKRLAVSGKSRKALKDKAHQATLLCLGLDELIYHYLRK